MEMDCVYRASSVEHADIVVAWLAEREISAFVKNRNMAGGYAPWAIAPLGVEVCVADPEIAAKARSLLGEHQQGLMGHRPHTPEKIVPVNCPECGRLTDFPGELFGSVQSCPKCGASVDVGNGPQVC